MTIKRIFFIVIMLAFAAKAEAQFQAGFGWGFNTLHKNMGVCLKTGYIAEEQARVLAEAFFYMPTEKTTTFFGMRTSTRATFVEYNINASWLFKGGKAYLYPLAGFNFIRRTVHETITYSGFWGGSGSSSETTNHNSSIGMNLGGGVQFNREGVVSPYIEFKYSFLSTMNNTTFGMGLLFNFLRKEY